MLTFKVCFSIGFIIFNLHSALDCLKGSFLNDVTPLRKEGQWLCDDSTKVLVLKTTMIAVGFKIFRNCVTSFLDDP